MKKLVKSVLTLVIALVTVFVLVACGDTPDEEQTLVVGSPEINGNFIAGFGSSAYDVWVRDLINGYSTYSTTALGEIVLNETVVDDVTTATDSLGNKTYTFVIHNDLVWNDGEKITARDFVFSLLMNASKEWLATGASSTAGDSLLGYADYRAGTTSADVRFKGVKLLSEYSFSVTINNTYLPYFYETAFASVGPMPMHVLAPEGATIDSNADGAKVGAGNFALLADVAKIGGYRYLPYVTAGQYSFVSFVNQVVTLKLNPTFKGNYQGKKATIENIIIKRVNSLVDVDLVISGELDLVTGVIEGAKIQKAQASAAADVNYYSRNGYGLLAMSADFGPTADYKVRQAIAFLTDRQHTTNVVLDGYGSITYSEYGLAQWMYVQSEDWVDANLEKYNFSITKANEVLNSSDWKYEQDGTTPFDVAKALPGSEYYRYNSAGVQLRIRHFGTENNSVTTSLAAKFVENMPRAGIRYDMTEGTFAVLLDHYYDSFKKAPEDRMYHIYNLATNFSVAYDPYYSWHSDWLGTRNNSNQLRDSVASPAIPLLPGEKTLDELTVALRTVEPGNQAAYLAIWKEYQLRWNKLIPNVPLYSNQYYDVFDSKLKGVETTPFWNWTAVIADMYFE